MSKYLCPALGGINENDQDLCPPKRTPENLCCYSCDLSTPNRAADLPACQDECLKIAKMESSCGEPVLLD